MEGHLAVVGDLPRSRAAIEYGVVARANLANGYRLAGYLLGDAAEAQDAVQEALIKAWRGWEGLRDHERFGPWFDRIVLNVCRDRMRRHRTIRMVELEAAGDVEADDPFHGMFDRDRLAAAVARLEPEQRIVIALRFWRDLSIEQVAGVLDVPVGTVKSRLHYALRALRAELGDTTDEA